jgi:hypothetical protein
MVLSHPDSRMERHAASIGNFSSANENYIESFMNVDNIAENDPSGTISTGQEMVSLLCSQYHALQGHTYVTLSRPLLLLRAVVQT